MTFNLHTRNYKELVDIAKIDKLINQVKKQDQERENKNK